MNAAAVLAAGTALVLLGGVAALVLARRARLADLFTTACLVAGLALCAGAGAEVLLGGASVTVTLQPALPGGAWLIVVDPLAAWFLVLIGVAGAGAAAYGVPYLAPERAHRPVAAAHALLALLLAAMIGVVVAQSAVLFLIVWELMAVSAYFLIVFESERRDVRRAGLIYLVLTHTGTLALLAMFLVWGRAAPDLTFPALAAAAGGIPWGGGLVLLLALFGFGVKAGVVPLHVWLPGAHAVAPSHVSAVLSGVMLKMGIYGLLRVISLTGGAPSWFGWGLFGIGVASGVLGLLWALAQHDLKRVLAFSSVENVGIICMGIGVGLLGQASGAPVVAALGFAAALLHALNHAVAKSLLFLGAGAVVRATGTRMIDRMGGVARGMPRTAAAFGIGAAAIVGLPPLNVFVGEWVAAQALLHGARTARLLVPAAVGMAALGLIGGLALACFARVSGSVFLGRARHGEAPAGEVWPLVAPAAGLAALCVAIGLAPAVIVGPASAAVGTIVGEAGAAAAVPILRGAASGLSAVGMLFGALALATWAVRRTLAASREAAHGTTWGCAWPRPDVRMQYTASSFGAPVLRAFGARIAPRVVRDATSFATDPGDRVLTGLVMPLWSRARAAAAALRPLQQGRVTRYLQYMVVTVIVLLAVLIAANVRAR